MLALAYLALFGIPLLAALHVLSRRGAPDAVGRALVLGWLAMPLLRIELRGLPELDKETLLASSIAAAVWIGRRRSGPAVRFGWFDLPMVCWCAAPLFASLSNGLGLTDGLSAVFRTTMVFGAPWLIGRLVLTDARAVMAMGKAMLLGAALYAPLCLIEARMAPQLHLWIYGMPGRSGWETVGFYGPLRFKASVFLQSPLELTPLMGMGCLFGWWMWRHLRERTVAGLPMGPLVALAAFATLMGKSLGGVTLTVGGILLLWMTRRTGRRVFVLALMAVVPLYVSVRASGAWDGMNFVTFLHENVSERRAESFLVRIDNENLLVAKALQQPVFGWGGWGRSRVYDEEGKDISITDGFWVIALGTTGWFGLASWMLLQLLPVAVALQRRWRLLRPSGPDAILLAALVVPLLHGVDCTANAMVNPIYYAVLGAVASYCQAAGRRPAQLVAAPGPEVPPRRVPLLRPRPPVAAR